jgi:ribosomal protein L16 Arg81 hydroxylase
MSVGLEDLIAPVRSEQFFDRYWDREPLVGGPAPDVAELLTLDQIEQLVGSLAEPDPDWMQVIRDGHRVDPSKLAGRQRAPSLSVVATAVREGYTLQLAKLHRRHAAVAAVCRDVESAFLRAGTPLARHAGSHAYVTPAGAVGLRPHYDDHSVFALQIAGTKLWRVRPPVRPFPAQRQAGPLDAAALGAVALEVELLPGSVLYVPRGWVHEAEAGGRTSVHVTIDLYPLTWLALSARLLESATPLREALPAGTWNDASNDQVRSELRDRIDEAVANGDLAAHVTDALNDFLLDATEVPGARLGSIDELAGLDSETLVRVRPSALATVLNAPECHRLGFVGSSIDGNGAAEALLRFIAAADVFAVGELPGALTDEARVELVSELLIEGVAELVQT